jgi:hypothetical protein
VEIFFKPINPSHLGSSTSSSTIRFSSISFFVGSSSPLCKVVVKTVRST